MTTIQKLNEYIRLRDLERNSIQLLNALNKFVERAADQLQHDEIMLLAKFRDEVISKYAWGTGQKMAEAWREIESDLLPINTQS